MASPPAPQGPPSLWLHLASRLGRVALVCLVVENFLLLFAPLAFLSGLPSNATLAPSGGAPPIVPLFTDASFLISLADLFAVIGFAILAPVLFLTLFALAKATQKVPLDTLLLGVGALACLAALVPVKLVSQGLAVGAVMDLDTVAATGGWSVASGLILATSLLYLFFALRAEARIRPRKLAVLTWPVYGAVNVLGAVAVAAFFQGLAAGEPNVDAYTLGIVLKVTLVPVLGVLAYRDLLDRFPNWALVPVAELAPVAPAHAHAPEPRGMSPDFVPEDLPPPPPPPEEPPLPPPPTD